jgi:hypothetical protein
VSAFRGSVAWTAVAEIAPHSAYCMLRPCLLGTRTIANRRPPGLPEGLMLNSWLIAARTNVELDSNSRFIEATEASEGRRDIESGIEYPATGRHEQKERTRGRRTAVLSAMKAG